MKQYDIWWAHLQEPAGRRPVLLLTRSAGLEFLNRFLVAEITTQIRDLRTEVLLGPEEGLEELSAANLDNLRTISRTLLVRQLGSLPAHRHREVKRALGFALGWPELIAL